MTNNNPSNKQQCLHYIDDGDSNSAAQHVGKLDKVREFLGIKTKTKELKNKAFKQSLNDGRTPQAIGPPLLASEATRQPIVASQPNDACSDDIMSISSYAPSDKLLSTPTPPTEAKRLSVVFTENLAKPTLRTDLPALLDRIEKTEQLVYCNALLAQASSLTTTADAGEGAANATTTTAHLMKPTLSIALQMKPTLTDKELKWLAEMNENPMGKAHIRWLATRMVEEFIEDLNKNSVKIAEIVILGPVLDREPYRKLLSSIIGGFEDALILDADLLQGLVQLVQSASPGFLVSDDLVKIFRVLRIRLQGTHQQSSEYSFHLTLAVSRVLDVMVEHEVKDLNRVEDHEPLSEVLSGLKGSSDPYLMYQTCYAFQALQYVPDDETALQAVLRHSTSVVNGLVKVSAVFKLDLGSILEGLGNLQKALGGIIGAASGVYEGVCTVMESGQGVWDSLKEGLGSGKKLPWYAAIRAAYALVQAGQLKDLHQLIYEAPCRRDPLFQWGICQLLGEIASDVVWDIAVRQHAIALLGELYKNDQDWGQDESVKKWMLRIIAQTGGAENQAVSSSARTLLRELKQDQETTTSVPYPLRNRLPLPSSSPILFRVQKIPFVEYDLHQLRLQRLQQRHQLVYILPLAKASLKAKDDDLFPLMEKVQEFLASERQVMLVLGDSGAGKSTFNHHLEHWLWTDYKPGGPIPLFINLPGIHKPDVDLVAKQLRDYNFEDDQIKELKLHRQLILICDAYDESQQLVNLHHTNMLNQPGQWDTKMIISCRTQFLGPTYLDRFRPQSNNRYASGHQDLFQEVVIAPFSKEQIENYVEQYVPPEPRAWRTQDYMDRLTTIPNLLDLVRNPFLLTLALEALPGVTEGKKDLSAIRITRVQLYDAFVVHWLNVNKPRLESNALSAHDRDIFGQLLDAGFISMGLDYSMKLALAIFDKQEGNPVVQYVHLSDKNTWKAEFFGPQPEGRLLRESLPLTRTGNQFRFVHRSMLEYFLSRVIYSPARIDDQECEPQLNTMSSAVTSIDANGPLFQRNLIKEDSIIQFLCDRVKSNPDFEQELHSVVNLSKTDHTKATVTAATNGITILVKAGTLFNGADLRGVKIPGADLSDGQFDSAQLQGADLTDVIFSRSWLRQADLSGARLGEVRFGELPYLETGDIVKACTYSPDGSMLAASSGKDGFSIYDTSTWTLTRRFTVAARVPDVAFSPNNEQIVSADFDGDLRMWDCASGEEMLVMHGHTDYVNSVAFSPCGKQIASASDDGTVRLWGSQTGESLFVLKGHVYSVTTVKYSPDGCQLVSGGWDDTIRFWNPQTGEPGAVLSPSLREVRSLAFSPDGRWVACGHDRGHLQLWNAASKEPGPVLRGHSVGYAVSGIEFSPSGQWIASCGGQTVRLWDAYSGTLHSAWSASVQCVAFSPDGLQIASGGGENKVRLWELSSSPSSRDSQDEDVHRMVYALDGRSILTQSFAGRILRRWDAGTGASSKCAPLEFADPRAGLHVAFTPDGSQCAVADKNGSIHLWNRRTGAAGPILEGHSSEIRKLIYSPCCRRIASVDDNNTVRLWDLHDMEQHRVLVEVHDELKGQVHVVVFSPAGDQLAIGYIGGTVRLFDVPTTERLICNKVSEGDLISMVYSPSGRQIAIGAKSGYIYLWDLQSKEAGAKLEGHREWVLSIAYSPCGQWIASGCDDETVGIWHRQLSEDVESWSRVHSIRSFFGPVDSVAWNPVVPMEFVTHCKDGSVRTWRLSRDIDENVVVKMLWGPNLGILCADGLALANTTGLSPVNQKLLVQRGAVSSITNQEEQE